MLWTRAVRRAPMTPLRLVLAGAAGSAAADFGDQNPRGLTHTVIGSLVVRGEQARHLEQFVTVGLRAARLFPSSPVTRRRFWGSGRSRSRVSAGRGRRPGRFRRRSPPPCFPRSGGRGRGTGGRNSGQRQPRSRRPPALFEGLAPLTANFAAQKAVCGRRGPLDAQKPFKAGSLRLQPRNAPVRQTRRRRKGTSHQ